MRLLLVALLLGTRSLPALSEHSTIAPPHTPAASAATQTPSVPDTEARVLLRLEDDWAVGLTRRDIAVFQRLHGRTEYEGTGIGLAVCRRITDRHHGTITARSQLGQGATFIVLLPVRQPKAAPPQ